MKYLVTLFFILGAIAINAQTSNLIVYTEDGEQFRLTVDGKLINETPNTNVKASGVNSDFVQIKVEFDIVGAPVVKSNQMITPGKEATYVVRKNNNGKYVVRLMSEVDVPFDHNTTEKIAIVQTTSTSTSPVQTTTYNETTTVHSNEPQSEGIGINVSANSDRFSMNVNINESGNYKESNSQSTTTVTSYSSFQSTISATVENNRIVLSDGRYFNLREEVYNQSFTSAVEMLAPNGANVSILYNDLGLYQSTVPFAYMDKNSTRSGSYFTFNILESSGVQWSVKIKLRNRYKLIIEPGNAPVQTVSTYEQAPATTPLGCQTAMSNSSFSKATSSIESKTFREEKMTVFKQIIKANCVSVDQVIEFMDLFTFEEDKIEVAKTAYSKTIDKGNYYQVNDAFTYSDSVEELDDFLQSQ